MSLSNRVGVLYVVATPIGNLGDLSERAASCLRQVALIAAEDTRHSRKLLEHLGLRTPLLSLHEHNEAQRCDQLLERLRRGEDLALISDAGTPLISDPGYRLVSRARQAGVRVSPIPGPSAVTAALSVCGLPTDRFVFEGFLPSRAGARRERLVELVRESRTLVLFEAPRRLEATLADCCDLLGGERRACLARELTKQFETVRDGTLAELRQWFAADPEQARGELVLLVAGAARRGAASDAAVEHSLRVLYPELGLNQAARLAARLHSVARRHAYDLALRIFSDQRSERPPEV